MIAPPGDGMDTNPLSVLFRPSHLRDRYRRLRIIAHSGQLAGLDPADDETLVVSTDWLAWRRWIDGGGHGVHLEHLLATWPADVDLNSLFIDAGRWMYRDDVDATFFHGVSLGKLFTWQVAIFHHAWLRLWHGLDRLCTAFRPDELVLAGCRMEFDLIDDHTARETVEALAARHGIRFVDRRVPDPRGAEPMFADMRFEDEFSGESVPRRLARTLYEVLIDGIFRLAATRWTGGERVLVIHNLLVVRSLVDGLFRGGPIPVLNAGHMPKTRDFLATCLRHRVLLARLPDARLGRDDLIGLAAIRTGLEAAWKSPASLADKVLRQFIRRRILDTDALRERALEVKRYGRMLRRHRIGRVLVGDSENFLCRTVLGLAAARGLPRDELLNGIFVSPVRMDSRNGDGGNGPLITRLLSWGQINERWLAATGSPVPAVRVGYPPAPFLSRNRTTGGTHRGRAVVLPLHIERTDLAALQGDVFMALIEAVRALRRAGYAEIRVKVHPGWSNREYFEAVLRYQGLDCAVFKDGALHDHLVWTDIVVGPVNSGAMMETLAMGKAYYPLMNSPTSLDAQLFPELPVSRSGRELATAIAEQRHPDPEAILELFCSTKSIPNPARRVLECMSTP